MQKDTGTSGVAYQSDAPTHQDRWIAEEVFKDRSTPGFFIEAGAADGFYGSNTVALERSFGWTGLCLEPNIRFFDQLIWNRTCLCLPYALSDRDGPVEFMSAGYLGAAVELVRAAHEKIGSDVYRHENYQKDFDGRPAVVLERRGITFRSLFQRYAVPPDIDYLSLDLEGGEEAALRGFPFDTHKILAATVENLMASGHQFIDHHHRAAVVDLLTGPGNMRSVMCRGVDEFFLHKDLVG